ncbi:imidazolonepropionase [Aquimarina sp. 2201CG14-23]|uniref:imidazolonepropionase n=1 Tax=Aquimarina mycalae TaxID=3040073 RepID=UPI002477E296|nr:imidazolonepropionase [Aquimarina sp. 2201CG14-23]MDH7446618.1 imidazolonepropionase [Aquimarina sp. 2201CG14-23]
MTKYKLIGPISQLLPMNGLPLKGALQDKDLPVINNAGILTEGEYIHSIGTYSDLVEVANSLDAEIVKLQSDYVCLPGFIDVHTHICFSGSRANDYAMRNSGKTYLEIAKAGGGIWDTVTNTRTADQQELSQGITKRANQLLKKGITTVEVKSGYGLSIEEELKMLRAIKEASLHLESDLIPTCLAAHMLPKDYEGTHQEYLAEISSTLFPILKSEHLTNRIDAFIEQSAFSKEDIHPYFQKATEMGFDITVHADQFTPGGSEIAVAFKAVSADHLEASTDKEIKILADSDVISVALPGASIGLGCSFTPARKILDAGGALAIASDWNPGSAPMGDLLTQACILGTFEKLSNAEILAGITYRASAALKLEDRGTLASRKLADFCLFPINHYNEILYHQGKLTPSQVWKRGDVTYIDKH